MIPTIQHQENESSEACCFSNEGIGDKYFDVKNSDLTTVTELDKEKPFIFGNFRAEEYDTLFDCNAQHEAIEFLCDTFNSTKTWVEEGAKYNFTYLNSLKKEELKNCLVDLSQNGTIIQDQSSNNELPKNELFNENEVSEKTSNGTITVQDEVRNKPINSNDISQSSKNGSANTWASLLFKSSSEANYLSSNGIQGKNSSLILSVQMDDSAPPVHAISFDTSTDLSLVAIDQDSRAFRLANTISGMVPHFNRHHLQLRGLINRGNWCYVNTILQALLGIPAISHFYKSLESFLNPNVRNTATPLTDCMIQFFNEFEPINPKVSLKKQSEDLRAGAAFEPKCVHEVLPVMKTSLSEKGRQEDAEEFLSFLLNGIHDELIALHKIATPQIPPTKQNGVHANGDISEEEIDGDNEAWEQVGLKNKSSTLREATIEESLIKHIFGGMMRSSVHQTGMKESTTLQPFFTLQLDIQPDNIWTLQDAIKSYFVKENLQGFNCSKTKTEVEASRRLSIEELPMIFIFHLKYFVFDRAGGCQKIHKHLDVPVDLEIPKDVMSPSTKNKQSTEMRKYKLYAVIYHHGKHAAGGHYTAAVHHGNPFGWVHFDDNVIKTVGVNQVLKHQHGCVPYLLFYERVAPR